jgi:hypothetical protein
MKYWEVGPFDSCVGIMVPDIACAGQMVREIIAIEGRNNSSNMFEMGTGCKS